MPRALGLIAGSGGLPLAVARSARARGARLVAVGFRGFADPALEGLVDAHTWLHVGELGALVETLRKADVAEAVLAGQVPKERLYGDLRALRFDEHALRLLRSLGDRRDHSILGALADWLGEQGVALLPQDAACPELCAPAGPLGGPLPAPEALADLRFGWPLARQLAALQVGQTLVVKDRSVLAVEAVEGTDAAIRRGGALGGAGSCVLKVARAERDPRFDLPTVGPDTLDALVEIGARLLAVEAGSTLLLEREALAARATEHGLALLGVASEGAPPEGR